MVEVTQLAYNYKIICNCVVINKKKMNLKRILRQRPTDLTREQLHITTVADGKRPIISITEKHYYNKQ